MDLTESVAAHRAAAGPDALRYGRTWYRDARRELRAIARDTGYTRHAVAGVCAAMAPRNRWEQNLRDTRDLCEWAAFGADYGPCPVQGLGRSLDRAWRILHGEAPLRVLGGPKTRAFYRNLTGNESVATVDVWAARAAGVTERELSRKGGYDRVAQAYADVAQRFGETVAQCQAITWCVVRGSAF